MLGGFLPPVVFTITSNAAQAIAGFSKVNAQLKLMEAQAAKTSKSMLALSKATAVATAAAKAFAVVFVAFAGYGVKEIMSLEQAYSRLGQSLAAVGLSTAQNREQLARTAQGMEELGFDAAQASDALALLIQTTKSVETSQKLLATAADLARARQMDLTTASRLLARAQAGNTRIFSMFGIQLDKTKDRTTAIKEAMDELTQVIGGQAEAYTKTFAGQLDVLGKQIENVAEGIGAALLPYLMKFLSALQKLFRWLNQNRDVLAGVAFVIGTILVAALTNMIRKMSIAIGQWVILNAKMLAIIGVILAVAAGFAKAWNESETFRKVMVNLGKALLTVGSVIVNVVENIVQAIYQIPISAQKAAIALRKLFGQDTREASAQLAQMEKQYAAIDKWSDGLEKAKKQLDGLQNKKIDLSKLKLPALKIPKFENGNTFGEEIADDITKGLTKARRDIERFNDEMKAQFRELSAIWKNIISRDFEKDIMAKIGDPIDQVIYDAQNAINAYANASSKYADVTSNLSKAQDNYVASLKSGNEELISAAEEALSRAEEATQGVYDDMGSALADIAKYQEQMITKVAQLYEEISELETERSKILKDAQKDRLELEANYNDEVARLRKDYDRSVLRAEQEAAKRRADIVKMSVDQLRNAFKNATYRSIGDIYQALTFEGRYIKGGTAEKILAALGLQTSKAEELAANAATLAGLGFSQTFIEEVVSQGPDIGNQLAKTIINSSPESIKQMQEYWNKLQAVSSHGVDKLANELNSGMKLATEELMEQMVAVDIELAATLKDLQDELTESLAESFNSYSKALDAINNRTAEQIAAIDAQITQLQAKIEMLKASLAAMQGLGAPGTQGAGVNIIPRAQTSEEEGAASSCESGIGIYKVVKYNGTVMSRTLIGCKPKTGTTTTDKGDTTVTTAPSGTLTAQGAYTAITGATTLTAINTAVNNAIKDSNLNASSIANAMASALLKSPDIAQIGGVAGALSSARYTGMGIATMNRGVTVNITANTNASSQDIANDVGWAIRTSGDVQYRTASGYTTDMRAE